MIVVKEVLKKAEEQMQKSVKFLESEYKAIRAGRATPAVLEKISVDYYGVPTAISQMAAVNVPESRMLTIQPWDASALKLIEKAILTSGLGINPQNDGKVIRLVFPPLTEERRKDIVKEVHKIAEDLKVAVRSIRRDSIEQLKSMKKDSVITEDDLKDGEKKAQDLTDKYIKEIDSIQEAKKKEIMEI